jgi:hypothetical protein
VYNVAILIASIRDPGPSIKSVLEAQVHSGSQYTFKIFLHSDKSHDFPHTECFIDKDMFGPMYSYNFLAKQMSKDAEFILTLSDGVCYNQGSFGIIEELKQFEDFGVTAFSEGGHPRVPECTGLSHIAEILRWPCFEATSLANDFDGHVFNPSFKYHVGDCWLGTYCYLMGKPRYESRTFKVTNCTSHDYRHHDDDHDIKILKKLCEQFPQNKNYANLVAL